MDETYGAHINTMGINYAIEAVNVANDEASGNGYISYVATTGNAAYPVTFADHILTEWIS